MLFKLAFRNVKRQISNYLIYFITVTFTVALIFAVNNIIFSELMKELQEYYIDFLQPLLLLLSGFLSIIIAFVLSYVTAFLLRRRKQEFGLYLTMGMTRSNILLIFAGETAFTFLLSLGFGMLLGLGLYQALMAIFVNFLEVELTLSGYSVTAILTTVIMVLVMFAMASVASLGYLRFAKISRLLNGDKTVEKTDKHPVLWFAVAAVAICLLVGSIVWFSFWLFSADFFEHLDEVIDEAVVIVIMFSVSVILLPIGAAKGILPLFIKRNEKTLNAKGTAVFTMRQLSGRLNANSVMAGVLTFLLLIAIILPNIFLTQNGLIKDDVKKWYPFDIVLYKSGYELSDEGYDFNREFELIKEYADIKEAFSYTIYEKGKNPEIETRVQTEKTDSVDSETNNSEWCLDFAIKQSVYYKLCEMLGIEPLRFENGYIVCDIDGSVSFDSHDYHTDLGEPIIIDGVAYPYQGSVTVLYSLLSVYTAGSFIVLPDSAIENENIVLQVEGLSVAITLKNSHYDAQAMWKVYYYEYGQMSQQGDRFAYFAVQEQERLDRVGQIALFLLGCLFVSAVFILLSMSMLTLKMLSMLSEDKQRYKTLWRLGANESMIFKSLFAQMFFFFFTPFALPLVLSSVIPTFLVRLAAEQGVVITGIAAFGQTIGFTTIILTLYALYFTVTYLIARREVKKSLRSN